MAKWVLFCKYISSEGVSCEEVCLKVPGPTSGAHERRLVGTFQKQLDWVECSEVSKKP